MNTALELDAVDRLDARQFLIAIKRLADSLMYGADASAAVGPGIEYAQSRPYEPGDAVRSIDWRVTARTRRVHVKEYEAPKQMAAYLLLDTSASMTISSTRTSKYARAVQIAGGVALACLQNLHPVALVGTGQRTLNYAPSMSRNRILQWLHELRTFHLDEAGTLAYQCSALGPKLVHRSLIIVLSDLNEQAALTPLKSLAQKHDCVALQFRDPAEDGLSHAGFIRGQEAETGRPFVTRGKQLGIDQRLVEAELKRARVDHLVIPTHRPFEHRLRYFFKSRGLLGRGAR